MSEARWKAKFTVASRVKREVCKRRRREDDKRKIRKGMDLSRERIASFHPSLKYASICTSPPLANRGSVFPISRERRVYEDLRATPARPVNSWREGGREGEEGNGKEWSNLEYPEYVRFADIVGNLVVTYRGRLKNSGARNSTCR